MRIEGRGFPISSKFPLTTSAKRTPTLKPLTMDWNFTDLTITQRELVPAA
jgi:hypothetical protein